MTFFFFFLPRSLNAVFRLLKNFITSPYDVIIVRWFFFVPYCLRTVINYLRRRARIKENLRTREKKNLLLAKMSDFDALSRYCVIENFLRVKSNEIINSCWDWNGARNLCLQFLHLNDVGRVF